MTDKELSQQAKEYFSQIKKTDRLIDRLVATTQTMRFSLISQSCELQSDRVQASGPKDRLEETFTRIDELERKINARIDEVVSMKQEAFDLIKKVPDLDQQNVLIARYVQGERWEKIAVDMNFAIAQVYRLHGKALVNFGKLIENDS